MQTVIKIFGENFDRGLMFIRFIRVEFRKAVITQITSRYICAEQKSLRTYWTLRQMNNSWGTCQVSVRLPDDSRNLRLQRSLESGTLKHTGCSGESGLLLRLTDGLGQNLASTAWIHGPGLPCVNSPGCWWQCKGWGWFSWLTLGPLIQICYRLNATVLATCILSWPQFTIF